jgi:deoxyadenosine/deoxycytidine kinase
MLLPKMLNIGKFISIQGNIGAGKSTLLSCLRELDIFSSLGNDRVVFVDEPVADWRVPHFRNGTKSMLDLFYEDMSRNAFLFQVNAFTTRQAATIAAMDGVKEEERVTIVSERSMMTDRLFAENLYNSGTLREEEWRTYCNFFDLVAGTTVKMEEIMIYVDVDYRLCHERIARRKRGEESTIPLEYLKSLQDMHEEMLVKFQANGGTVIRVQWVDTEEGSKERESIIESLISDIPVAITA